MKVKRLVIKNVTSYRTRTEFNFDNGVNILIGPNGGGKTNLQKILALTLSKYFIHQYQFRSDANVVGVERVDPWTQRILPRLFTKYAGDESEQLLELEIIPEARDVENIKTIGANLDKFNNELRLWEKRYDSYAPLEYAESIATAPSFTFRIVDLDLVEPSLRTAEWAFLEYLREFFIFARMASHIPDVTLSSPVFFFSSERTQTKTFEIQAGQLNEQTYLEGYRSAYSAATGDSMNLMQWGTQHFVRLHRRSVIAGAAATGKTWQDVFYEYPDVKVLTRYLDQLGYKWTFKTDRDQTSYWFHLVKDGRELSTDMFSSGEREIVHFLLAMFALNVNDGLILVDEPELHLHPRWQRIFLGLFRDLAPERNNQIIITTHSPAFITPDTIDSVTRVYRAGSGSTQVALRSVALPKKKTLVRMINSQNNERLFFADKVVLVEGISDRLIFESLLDSVCTQFNISTAIEVVEVGGKYNFSDYAIILKGLLTPVYTIADRDYLTVIGSEDVRALFTPSYQKEWSALVEGKKSVDRKSMLDYLDAAIRGDDAVELRKFWDYFRNRLKSLKEPLTSKESSLLGEYIGRLGKENIFVLRDGEIEDYLPVGARDVRGIVDLVSDRMWLYRLTIDRRIELGSIISLIVQLPAGSQAAFLDQLKLDKGSS